MTIHHRDVCPWSPKYLVSLLTLLPGKAGGIKNGSHKTLVSCHLLQMSLIRVKWRTHAYLEVENTLRERMHLSWNFKEEPRVGIQSGNKALAFEQREEQNALEEKHVSMSRRQGIWSKY